MNTPHQLSFFEPVNPSLDLADLISRGALFVINHSGGKDSQAMFHKVRHLVPKDQLIVIHAHLPEVEWDGTEEHVRSTCTGYPVYTVTAQKTFFQMVEKRGLWPSPQYRQCTSDLKRGPIEKLIRRLSAEMNCRLIVNCMGLRAEESPQRSKRPSFKFNERNSKAGREWYDWLPVHDLTTDQIFQLIQDNDQEPHWAYKAGMTRLSCCFCIMSSRADLKTAARLRPDLLKRYTDLERKLDHTFLMPVKGKTRFLDELLSETPPEPTDLF